MQKIQYIDIHRLITHPDNPRLIKDDKFKILCESIKDHKDYFETRPILCNKDMVVFAGNMRLRAAEHIGMKEVPTAIMDISEERQKELMVRDNVQNGEWDVSKLASLYEEADLTNYGVDLSDFGVYEEYPDTDKDDVAPEPSEATYVQRGDIFLLGEHRLMCGDSTDINDVEKLMNGKKADMVFTDPPYNVAYVGKTKEKLTIDNDQMSADDFKQFCSDFITNLLTFCKGSLYICMSSSEWGTIQNEFIRLGGHWSRVIIWVKDRMVLSRADYHTQFEPIAVVNEDVDEEGTPILYGWKEGEKHLFRGGRKQTDVWRINRPSVNDVHPTMKPIELVERAIINSSKKEAIVMDLFLGSGSTLIAAQKTERICYGMELDPKYVEVIINRWEEYTGKQAIKA